MNPQNCRNKQKILEKGTSAPNLGSPKRRERNYEERNGAEPFCQTILPKTVKHRRFPRSVSENAPFCETALRDLFLFLCVFRFCAKPWYAPNPGFKRDPIIAGSCKHCRCNRRESRHFGALSFEPSFSHLRKEHSMDQYRSRPKLSENFAGHWSIPFSGEIHMDQSLVHTFSWGNSYGPMVLKVFQKFPPTLVLVHGWLFPTSVTLARFYGLWLQLA